MTRALRIGIVAPPWLPVPPDGYGGTEAVIDVLCRGLDALGHEVHLFASGDSTSPVDLQYVNEVAPGIDVGGMAVELDHVIHAYAAFDGLDIIHDHTTVGPFYGRSVTPTPIVTTNHNRFVRPFRTGFAALAPDVPVIAISHHHASTATGIRIGAVIHHGVEPEDFPVGSGSGGYVLFLGRMVPEKGAHRAISAAIAAGVEIYLAGKATSAQEIAYLEEEIWPLLGPSVHYLGEVDRQAKFDLLGGARCLLNPIGWDEPFGMVMIEALACGTPVVALRSGSVPEIVEHGVTGLVVDTEAELVAAIAAVAEIDRAPCRAAVEGHFSAERMAAEHAAFYESVIATRSAHDVAS